MQLGRDTSGATGIDLAGVGREVLEELRIKVVDLLNGISKRRRGMRRFDLRRLIALCSVFGPIARNKKVAQKKLALLAVESATLEIGVEYDFSSRPGVRRLFLLRVVT